MKILIVDDEKEILVVLEEFVSGIGHMVATASNYAEALSLIRQTVYDLIVLDKNFMDDSGNPEGGMVLLKYAREHSSESEIIMMTGYASIESAVDAMKLGAVDYLIKPFELSDIAEKIAYIDEYKSFLDSKGTLHLFKTLNNQVLSLLQNKSDLPEAVLNQLLQKLGRRIDQVFGAQKEYERLIKIQAEALEKIEYHTEFLKNAIPEGSPYYGLIEKILNETKKRT